jgi:hypothetical protein
MSIHHATEVLDIIRRDGDIDAVVYRIKDTNTTDTVHQIQHGLGRVPVGCVVQKADADCGVYVMRENTELIEVKFTAASADVNIRIW